MARDGMYVVVYDISDDKERAGLATLLEGFGLRVQASVFECRLTGAMKRELLRRIEGLELQTGFVLLYRIRQDAKREACGQCPPWLLEEPYAFIV